MAGIFITGSSDRLGQLAAARLLEQVHLVVLHARNAMRAEDVNSPGTFDAVINNAGFRNNFLKNANI